jgi:hypothetical protein
VIVTGISPSFSVISASHLYGLGSELPYYFPNLRHNCRLENVIYLFNVTAFWDIAP